MQVETVLLIKPIFLIKKGCNAGYFARIIVQIGPVTNVKQAVDEYSSDGAESNVHSLTNH